MGRMGLMGRMGCSGAAAYGETGDCYGPMGWMGLKGMMGCSETAAYGETKNAEVQKNPDGFGELSGFFLFLGINEPAW